MRIAVLVMAAALMAGPVLAQEGDLTASEVLEKKAPDQADTALKAGDVDAEAFFKTPEASQWIWGMVESVDFAGNTLALKHLDYETAEEVTRTLYVDDKTVFQGDVMGLADIEPTMHVSVEYKEKDGRWVADVIEVEPVN